MALCGRKRKRGGKIQERQMMLNVEFTVKLQIPLWKVEYSE